MTTKEFAKFTEIVKEVLSSHRVQQELVEKDIKTKLIDFEEQMEFLKNFMEDIKTDITDIMKGSLLGTPSSAVSSQSTGVSSSEGSTVLSTP